MKAALVSIAHAHVITGTIDRKQTSLDFSQVSVTLNNGEYNGLVDIKGGFAIQVPD